MNSSMFLNQLELLEKRIPSEITKACHKNLRPQNLPHYSPVHDFTKNGRLYYSHNFAHFYSQLPSTKKKECSIENSLKSDFKRIKP